MKLSTRSRYGMRAMHELARNYENGPLSISTISKNLDISSKYLHALLTILKSGGLVRSVWGSQGGFVLSCEPSEINLYDVVKTLEGPLSLVECVRDSSICKNSRNCAERAVWTDVTVAIENVLSDVTLDDLLNKKKKRKLKK